MTVRGPVVVVATSAVVARKLASAVAPRDLIEAAGIAGLSEVRDAPAAVVIDLDLPAALDAPPALRARWPSALLAAFVGLPDRARWESASEVFDLVATRGAIASQLAAMLDAWSGPRAGARARLFEEADAAGRIGVVYRGDTPAGPVAVYHLARELHACADVCPHAGARLSEGTVSGTVVTCPRHGSQFDVRDGSRVRGPADEPIASYPLVVDGGIVSMIVE